MISEAIATLVALTDEAEHALGGRREVHCPHFPFNVGRESHHASGDRRPVDVERRRPNVAAPTNDVNLVEPSSSTSLHVSRGHFAIDLVDGQFYLVDRGSACGTIVAGRQIGGNHTGGRMALRDGDEVIVGTSRSPYVFRFGVFIRRTPANAAAANPPYPPM